MGALAVWRALALAVDGFVGALMNAVKVRTVNRKIVRFILCPRLAGIRTGMANIYRQLDRPIASKSQIDPTLN
jgi:hypothetical protein